MLVTNRRHVAINLAISEERYDDICCGTCWGIDMLGQSKELHKAYQGIAFAISQFRCSERTFAHSPLAS